MIAVAKIVKPIGIRGEVKIQLLTDHAHRLEQLDSIWIGHQEQTAVEYHLRFVRRDAKHCVVSLKEVDSVEPANGLRDQYCFIADENSIQPDEGRYFIDAVIGCEMKTLEGKLVGAIVDVLKLPANDLWVVQSGNKEILIPAVKAIVKEIDIRQKRVVIDSPEGLLE